MVKNPNIERIIDFMAKFACSLSIPTQNNLDKTNLPNRTTNNQTNDQTVEMATCIANTTTSTSTSSTVDSDNPLLVTFINFLISVIIKI
jgi:hypothetical protein